MKKKCIRSLTIILSILLLVALLPIPAFALDCVQSVQYLGWSDDTNSYSIQIHDDGWWDTDYGVNFDTMKANIPGWTYVSNKITGSWSNAYTGVTSIGYAFYYKPQPKITYEVIGDYFTNNSYAIQYYDEGATISLPPAPAEYGYNFSGWDTSGIGPSMGASDCIITGSFSPVSNAVSYSYGGSVPESAPVLPETVPHDYNTPVYVAEAPTLAGYMFSGWSTLDTTVSGGSFTMPAQSVAFTGSWLPRTDTPFQIEYFQQDISDDDYTLFRTDQFAGTTDTEIPLPTENFEGFTFNPDAAGSVTSATINGDGSGILKLFYDRDSYNVIFQITGDTFADGNYLQESCRYGTPITLPAAADHTGYTFSGWAADGVGLDGTEEDGYTVPAHDVAMTGGYTIHSFPVTYSFTNAVPGESALPATVTYDYGESISLAPDAAALGYVFSGWSCDDAAITDGSFTMPDHAVHFTGSWMAGSNSYRVEYYWETPDGTAYQLHEAENLAAETAAEVQAGSKEYTGFTINAMVPDSITEGMVAADGSTVLRLFYDRKTYKVLYQITGSLFFDDKYLQRIYLYGAPVPISDEPEKKNSYLFSGWNIASDSFDGTDADGYTMPDHDVTVTGSWYSVEDDVFKLSLVADGSTLCTLTARKGDDVTLNETPTHTGYVFKGWSTSPSGGVKYQTGDLITISGNLILYAVYSRTGYVQGYADGLFRPDDYLTRDAAWLIFSRLGISSALPSDNIPLTRKDFIALAAQLGSISAAGEETAYLTRAEAIMLLNQALGYTADDAHSANIMFADVPSSYWAYKDIMMAAN